MKTWKFNNQKFSIFSSLQMIQFSHFQKPLRLEPHPCSCSLSLVAIPKKKKNKKQIMKPPLPPPSSSSVLRKARLSPYFYTLLTFILFVVILYSEDFLTIFGHGKLVPTEPISETGELVTNSVTDHIAFLVGLRVWLVFLFFWGLEKKREMTSTVVLPFAKGKLTEEGCDIFRGRWVRDELNRPLYEESECPYIQPQLTCQEHGRPDKEYQKWRWQPHACDLPR